jgi:hypothetical protein
MNNKITGFTKIDSAEFVFYLNDYFLTLVYIDGGFPEDIKLKKRKVDILKGTTSCDKQICFFTLSLCSPDETNVIYSAISSYFIGDYQSSYVDFDSFSAISFTGCVIDKYFSPANKLNGQKQSNKNEPAIFFKPDSAVDFIVNINTNQKLKFSVSDPTLPGQYGGVFGNMNSSLFYSTDVNWGIADLINVYRSIYGLFAFLNFRSNISFKDVALYKRVDSENFLKVATYYVAIEYPCTEVKAIKTIIHPYINEKIADLFDYVQQLQKHLCFIPSNDVDSSVLDYQTYMVTCSVFEKVFSWKYPDRTQRNPNPEKIAVRDQVVEYLETLVAANTDRKHIEASNYLNAFRSQNKSKLYDRFIHAFEDNTEILKEVFPNFDFTSTRIANIAYDFVQQRNFLDHGDFEEISALRISSYTYAVCLIYIMILRLVGLDENMIATIVKYMFWNYEHKDISNLPI